MFIGRGPDGAIYGCWTTRQADDEFHPGQEEVADDDPQLVAFQAEQEARISSARSGTALRDRRRAEQIEALDRAIAAAPAEQQPALRAMQKLLGG